MQRKEENLLRTLEEKWLNGTITDEEAAIYAEWYNQDQSNPVFVPSQIAESRDAHRNVLFRYIHLHLYGADQTPGAESDHGKGKIKRLLLAVGSVAAVLILGTFFVFHFFLSGKELSGKRIADVAPGHCGMVLTFDGGRRRIIVDPLKDGWITRIDGMDVFKRKGKLVYTGTSSEDAINIASTDTGRQFCVQLPDGSLVYLNAATSIRYSLDFKKKRVIDLDGEAYFEIKANPHHPFRVNVHGKIIEVLGTHFNVSAYANEPYMITTLLTGKVAVHSGNQRKILKPDEAAYISPHSSEINISKADVFSQVQWRQQEFNFDNVSLREIMHEIERWYGIKVSFDPDVNFNMRFAGSTPMNQNLSEVLKVLQLGGLKFELDGKRLIVKN